MLDISGLELNYMMFDAISSTAIYDVKIKLKMNTILHKNQRDRIK